MKEDELDLLAKTSAHRPRSLHLDRDQRALLELGSLSMFSFAQTRALGLRVR